MDGQRPTTRIEVPLRQVARAVLVFLGLWALANALWLGREIVFVAFFAALFAVFLSIGADRLKAIGVPRGVAVLLILLLLFGATIGAGWLLWPTLQDQFEVVSRRLPQALDTITATLERMYRSVLGGVGTPDPVMEGQLRERLGQQAMSVVSGALPLLNTIFGSLLGLFIVIFAGAYLAIEPDVYKRGLEHLLPPDHRPRILEALDAAGANLKRWMLGQIIAMTIIGVLSTLGLWLLGVPAPLVLGLIAGLLQFIPVYGPIMSAVPAAGMALLVSPSMVLWVLLLYAGIQQVESNFITPFVMRETAQLPPALTMVFQALMGILFGFLGLLVAVPFLAAALVLIDRLYVQPVEERASG